MAASVISSNGKIRWAAVHKGSTRLSQEPLQGPDMQPARKGRGDLKVAASSAAR